MRLLLGLLVVDALALPDAPALVPLAVRTLASSPARDPASG
jgi:hypothetical protein